MFSTHDKIDEFVASCNGCLPVIKHNSGSLKVGAGECLPEWPEGGLPGATTSHRDDLQAESSSLPVENRFCTEVDTHQINTAQTDTKGITGQQSNKEININNEKGQRTQKGVQLLGCVSIQIVNLSLEKKRASKAELYRGSLPHSSRLYTELWGKCCNVMYGPRVGHK